MADEETERMGVHWDKWNRPVGYIIASTPGFAQFEQGEQRLANMGLARKITKAARLGFDFAEIDYETLSEMYEKDVEMQIKHVKEVQKMEVGIHLPVKVDLCIANAFEWKEMHEILRKGAYSAKEVVGAKFFLFHTSSRIRPHVTFTVGHQEPSVQQNSFSGMNLGEWIDDVDHGEFRDHKTEKIIKAPKSMREWFKARHTRVLFHVMGLAGDVGMLTFLEGYEDFRKAAEEAGKKIYSMRQKAWDDHAKAEVLGEFQKTIRDMEEKINNRISIFTNEAKSKGAVDERQINAYVGEKLRNDPDYKQAESVKEGAIRAIGEVNTGKPEKDISEYIVHGKEEAINKWLNGGKRPEESLGDLSDTYKEYQVYRSVWHYVVQTDFDKVFDFWTRKGSECEEQIAYRVIAKFMYWTKDPLWTDIVGDYDPDIIIKCADVGRPYYDKNIYQEVGILTGKLPEKEENKEEEKAAKNMTKRLVEKLITAVACKYIQGHLFTEGNLRGMKGEFTNDPTLNAKLKDESVYKYTRAANIQIYIETAMPPEGQEGELRIMSAHDHVTLAKHLDGGEFTAYTMDFEHLTVNFVRVDEDIASLKEGDGKYIRMMHINAPRPVIGAHAPLEILSHDMFIIYTWLYKLRQKGMRNAYLIWEMGSFGIQRSAIAFRNIVAELERDVSPLNLPSRFYGIDETIFAAQHNAIREHGLDPLKGLFMVPEVDHGVFSRAAHEKGKAKEWEEEKYKY